MKKIKVSVIIPIYNSQKFISKCVSSVLNQTYSNLEIILVDDGSTDNSPLLCDEYAKKDKRVLTFHKTNGGPSSARNFALDHMTGDYVCFIDSDDYIESDMIEIMLNELIQEEADDVICLTENDKEELFKTNIYENILKDEIGSQMWRHLFKSSLFTNVRFPLNRFAEDTAILDRILYKAKIAVIYRILYHYNKNNSENVSNNRNNLYKNTVDRAIAFAGRYKWIKDKKDISNEVKNIILAKTTTFCLATFCRCKNNSYNKNDLLVLYNFLKKYKKDIKILHKFFIYKKIAVSFLLNCPRLFCTLGTIVSKIK